MDRVCLCSLANFFHPTAFERRLISDPNKQQHQRLPSASLPLGCSCFFLPLFLSFFSPILLRRVIQRRQLTSPHPQPIDRSSKAPLLPSFLPSFLPSPPPLSAQNPPSIPYHSTPASSASSAHTHTHHPEAAPAAAAASGVLIGASAPHALQPTRREGSPKDEGI